MILLYAVVAIIYCLIFSEYIQVDFNIEYTLTTIGVYLISNILYFRKKKNIVSFEFLFALTFALACFLTYFIVEEGGGFAFFAFSSNPKSLVKGIALAMIGYHCYLCGLLSFKRQRIKTFKRHKVKILKKHKVKFLKRQKVKTFIGNEEPIYTKPIMASLANWTCLMVFMFFMATGGMNVILMYSGDIDREDANIGTLLYWILSYSVAVFVSFSSAKFSKSRNVLSNTLKLNKLFLVNTVIIIVFLLLSGYRSQAMQIIIPLLICYSIYVKKISAKIFFMILIVGMVIMVVIGMTRSGGDVENNVTMLYYFRDFNAANASLGFFVDEVSRNGVTGGSNYIPQTLSIIPFLQSIVGSFIDFNYFALPSSRYYTGVFDSESGLGTNIIGDIYYTFGLVGVISVMFIMGMFCSYLSQKKNKYVFLMYLIFTGNSIFAARVELLYVVRMLTWGCIILFAITIVAIMITFKKNGSANNVRSKYGSNISETR